MTWRRAILYGALATWFVAIIGAFALIWRYKETPGALAAAPATWPVASKLERALDRPNVVFVAHPQCPCTRASMTELAHLIDEVGTRARVHIVVVRPAGAPADFEEGAIIARARQLPGARVVVDVDGKEAHAFGAIVSGSTIVYGRAGTLQFRGGLTTARGHEGRGPAHDRILAIVGGAAPDRHDAPTFGCALDDETRQAEVRR